LKEWAGSNLSNEQGHYLQTPFELRCFERQVADFLSGCNAATINDFLVLELADFGHVGLSRRRQQGARVRKTPKARPKGGGAKAHSDGRTHD